MTSYNSFKNLVNTRRSVRKYNQETPFNHEAVAKAIDLAVLSPNSSNMQLWEFHRVVTPEKRKEVAGLCLNQSAARTARELVMITVRPDKWKKHAHINGQQIREAYKDDNSPQAKRARSYYEKLIPTLYNNDGLGVRGQIRKLLISIMGRSKPVVREVSREDVRISIHKSAALAAMTFMYAMESQGYNTCPLEGFDSRRIKKSLNMPSTTEICMIICCGEGAEGGIYGEQFRVPTSELVYEY